MTVDAISAVGAPGTAEFRSVATPGVDFAASIGGGLQAVDGALKTADLQVRMLAAGQEVAPHDIMISLEEARMHLMLLAEVRNRAVEAYQELTRMQL